MTSGDPALDRQCGYAPGKEPRLPDPAAVRAVEAEASRPAVGPIEHRYAERRFVVRAGAREAHLAYHRRGRLLEIHTTFVPDEARGAGLAEVLCEEAFRYAEAHGHRVRPTCSYVRETFLARRPAWRRLVES